MARTPAKTETAASSEKGAGQPATTMLRITAKRDGFRRCGVAHPDKATDHPLDRFTPEQLEVLRAEPMLVVHEAEVDAEPAGEESAG